MIKRLLFFRRSCSVKVFINESLKFFQFLVGHMLTVFYTVSYFKGTPEKRKIFFSYLWWSMKSGSRTNIFAMSVRNATIVLRKVF